MKFRSITASLVAAAGLLAASSASADLVLRGSYIQNPPSGPQITYDSVDDRGQLSCSSCEGLLSDLADGIYDADVPSVSTVDGFSTLDADLFFLANSSGASEAAFVNAAAGTSFSVGAQIDGGSGNLVFTTDAEYILLKIGATPDYALIQNTGGLQTFSYVAFQGEGAGLSHYVLFGNTVAEPSILALFGMGLLLLGFSRRRTNV